MNIAFIRTRNEWYAPVKSASDIKWKATSNTSHSTL